MGQDWADAYSTIRAENNAKKPKVRIFDGNANFLELNAIKAFCDMERLTYEIISTKIVDNITLEYNGKIFFGGFYEFIQYEYENRNPL